MNKKLKKALYMFGFALPIVAIPIITVACGTQTSQITPKEADKNQNEQVPKQETPIQDENKKVTVLSSLSSSKIYDENLLNSNVIELIKLFNQYKYELMIKKNVDDALRKNVSSMEKAIYLLNILNSENNKKIFQEYPMIEEKVKKIINNLFEIEKNIENAVEATTSEFNSENINQKNNIFLDDLIKKAVEKVVSKIKDTSKSLDQKITEALEDIEIDVENKDTTKKDFLDVGETLDDVADDDVYDSNIEEESEDEKKDREQVENIANNKIKESNDEINKIEKKVDNIKSEIEEIRNEWFYQIEQHATNLYKKIFSIETSESIDFNELRYDNFLSKLFELRLSNFFNIENLKKYLQNLTNDNKLNEISLKDIFNTNINNIIESLKEQNKNIKLLNFEKNEQKIKIIELLNQNNTELSNKIKDKLSNLTNFENIESLLREFAFSDLFDVDKLQQKLN